MAHDNTAAKARSTYRTVLRGAVLILLVLGAVWRAAPVDAASEPTSYYLSLGDSLAQGFQPIGGPHTNSGAVAYNQGYADQLLKIARTGGGQHLRLVKLGCGGETTASLIEDSLCRDDYVTGSQLGDAVRFLDEHRGQMAFITIDIGVNDIFECEGVPACFGPQIATNLPLILDTLRDHAGPGVPVVGMNYPSPFVVDWFDDPAAGQAAAANIVAFNNFLESLYAGAGVPVADVESAFAVTDFTTLANLKGVGPVPLSVYNACTLGWACTGPPLGPDIHPNSSGYRVEAEAFATVLGV
ncbi:MAG TPA: SGNH/GDSL hydrolase family protein [Acidimicrobiales bacterium]|nr:SGNH/GDSL hydrolase family protein [Acidimicrobiales bacterium]